MPDTRGSVPREGESLPRSIRLQPIGVVRTSANELELQTNRANVVSEVVVDEAYSPALKGVEGYSHLIVLFWLHRVTPQMRKRLIAGTPRKGKALGLGVFAMRGRSRPNPIGLAVVELLGLEGNALKVRALDALDGTPVLDIKPYDFIDRKEEIRVPGWWRTLHPGAARRSAAHRGPH